MIRTFYLLLLPLLLITFLSCDNQKVVDVDVAPECEILSPVSGQIYSPYNPLHLIARYDRMKFNAPWWQFSLDEGKTWKDITITGNDPKSETVLDVIYDFDVKQWTPFDDTLVDTLVWIKASAYAGTKYVITKNIIIKP